MELVDERAAEEDLRMKSRRGSDECYEIPSTEGVLS